MLEPAAELDERVEVLRPRGRVLEAQLGRDRAPEERAERRPDVDVVDLGADLAARERAEFDHPVDADRLDDARVPAGVRGPLLDERDRLVLLARDQARLALGLTRGDEVPQVPAGVGEVVGDLAAGEVAAHVLVARGNHAGAQPGADLAVAGGALGQLAAVARHQRAQLLGLGGRLGVDLGGLGDVEVPVAVGDEHTPLGVRADVEAQDRAVGRDRLAAARLDAALEGDGHEAGDAVLAGQDSEVALGRALQRHDALDARGERRREEGRRPAAREHDLLRDVARGDELEHRRRRVEPDDRSLHGCVVLTHRQPAADELVILAHVLSSLLCRPPDGSREQP